MIIVSTRALMLAFAGKARVLVALVAFLQRSVCAKSDPRHFARLRKLAVTNKGVQRDRHALQSTLKHFTHVKEASLTVNYYLILRMTPGFSRNVLR